MAHNLRIISRAQYGVGIIFTYLVNACIEAALNGKSTAAMFGRGRKR